ETAGLKCPPEIGPNAYAPVTTVKPKASETPSKPIPTSGKAAASTALPQPPRTSQKVPMNSADSFANMPHLCLLLEMFAADLMPAGERYLAPCPLHVTRAPFDQLFQHVAEQRVAAIEDPAGERLLARESLASRVLGHVPDFDHGRVMQIARPRCRVWSGNFCHMHA